MNNFLMQLYKSNLGQARIDGAFCDFNLDEKMKFLNECSQNGVKNIEMESLCFTGLLNHAKLKGNERRTAYDRIFILP